MLSPLVCSVHCDMIDTSEHRHPNALRRADASRGHPAPSSSPVPVSSPHPSGSLHPPSPQTSPSINSRTVLSPQTPASPRHRHTPHPKRTSSSERQLPHSCPEMQVRRLVSGFSRISCRCSMGCEDLGKNITARQHSYSIRCCRRRSSFRHSKARSLARKVVAQSTQQAEARRRLKSHELQHTRQSVTATQDSSRLPPDSDYCS
jgi:hypothetical protein